MSYIILRGCWCHIIVLSVHAPTEDKIDDVKDNFYEELECVFDKFPKYHTKILLGDFNSENEFKRGYQLRNNLVKDENGDLSANSHILDKCQ
jgi:hypothetical protein